ncbi:DUF3530 family protein [Aliiglaciecola sp. CAU 1673]|uniref:DUF3530 family protein n=1 Tax=Aliiglaciecola sp. CAU 1673 TaxID=3032595 RepID=UPI0023D9FEE9|nr:DUF3530 family protein [Aliiglaciecola sp. CAU 1673]MDF2179003.1 DUF3530 family protein [Aliiglaciecola sp. CAU 1673]
MKLSFLSLLLFLLFGVTAAASDGHLQDNLKLSEDLKNALPSSDYRMLMAGEDEFAILLKENTTPITKGVALLIGELGPPLGKSSLAPLAAELNKVGWVTVLMAPPDTVFSYEEPSASSATNGTPDTQENSSMPKAFEPSKPMTKAQFEQHEMAILQRLLALQEITSGYPGFFLVVAQGTSAAWLVKLYAEGKTNAPDAMVTVSPFWPLLEENAKMATYMARLPAPLLDIFSAWDNDWSKSHRLQRQLAVKKSLKLHYRQREIIGQGLPAQQHHYLAKEIYGWLTAMGW